MARKFLFTFFISLISGALFVFAFIYYIDPYYVNQSQIIKGLNDIKPDAYRHKFAAKRSLFLRGEYETLILGNSRVDLGFNPASKNWPEFFGATFNFGIPGALLDSNLSNFYFAEENNLKPKKLILLLDFYNYISPHKAEKIVVGDEKISPWVDGAFSLTAFGDAINTVRAQYMRNPDGMTMVGYNPVLPYNDIVSVEGHFNFAQQVNRRFINTFRDRMSKRTDYPDRSGFDLSTLTQFSRELKNSNIELFVILSPYHVDVHTILEEMNMAPLLDAWKSAVVNAVVSGNPSAQVWDFALINEVTLESIPQKADRSTKMKWFWEPGHFKASLGDVIACELSSGECEHQIGSRLYPEGSYAVDSIDVGNHPEVLRSKERIQKLM